MSDATDQQVMGFNPFEPGFFEDPYSQYALLRESDEPVHQTAFGAWVVTRWEDVHALLRRPGMSVEDRNVTGSNRREQLALLVPDEDGGRRFHEVALEGP